MNVLKIAVLLKKSALQKIDPCQHHQISLSHVSLIPNSRRENDFSIIHTTWPPPTYWLSLHRALRRTPYFWNFQVRGIKGALNLQAIHTHLSFKVSSTLHFKLLCFFLVVQLSLENLFLFLKQSLSVMAMRSSQKTALLGVHWHHCAQWPFQPRQNWAVSRGTCSGCGEDIFSCFCCLSAGQKSHNLGKSLNFSSTVWLVYFLTLFVQHLPHWNQKPGWRLWALDFPELLEECIT